MKWRRQRINSTGGILYELGQSHTVAVSMAAKHFWFSILKTHLWVAWAENKGYILGRFPKGYYSTQRNMLVARVPLSAVITPVWLRMWYHTRPRGLLIEYSIVVAYNSGVVSLPTIGQTGNTTASHSLRLNVTVIRKFCRISISLSFRLV